MPNPDPIEANSPTISPFPKDCTVHIPYTDAKTFADIVLLNQVGEKETRLIVGDGIRVLTKKKIKKNDMAGNGEGGCLEIHFHGIIVMAASTIPVSAEENLEDPIDIRVDVIHPEPIAAVAFPAAAIIHCWRQKCFIGTSSRLHMANREITRNVERRLVLDEQQLAADSRVPVSGTERTLGNSRSS
ncbi:hypothetical protein Tco_1458453 [Tanacetum coccineum]